MWDWNDLNYTLSGAVQWAVKLHARNQHNRDSVMFYSLSVFSDTKGYRFSSK